VPLYPLAGKGPRPLLFNLHPQVAFANRSASSLSQ